MTERMFAPLLGARRPPRARAGSEGWNPLLPVPGDAPQPPSTYYKHGKPARIDTYRDAGGAVLGYVARFDPPDGGKEFLPLTYCENGATGRREWRWKGFPVPRPLYGLDRLAARPEAPVVLCEGEKAADAAGHLLHDWVAITSHGGSNGAGRADWTPLAGRRVVIWPDADEPGRKYADAVAAGLARIGAASVAVAEPPADAPVGWDAANALAEGWDVDRTRQLIESARPAADPVPAAFRPAAGTEADGATLGEKQPNGGRRRPAQSAGLIDLVEEAELWHSPDRDAFGTIAVDDHYENWPVRSKGFRLWLTGRYFDQCGGAPGGQAMEDALRVIEARAIHQGPEYEVFLRVGERAGAVYLDLADGQWRAVKVTEAGWQVIERSPIKFLRSNAMQPLPVPERGESVDLLRELLNVRTEGDFKLAVAWLVGALRPRGPYPILAVNGEQGSAKSTLSRVARGLVDPNMAPIRSAPRDEQSLLVAARNSWAIVLDNLSELAGWLSDALCRLATGGGFGTRELFTDWNETIVQAERPIIINGIPELASRPDLADRCISLTLPAILDTERRTESAFWAEFEAKRPAILGALLDAVSGALQRQDEVSAIAGKTRMADFALWVTAAEPALGWRDGDLMEAYSLNREGAVETAIEQDPIGQAVRDLAEDGDWEGTATALLAELEKRVSEPVCKSRIWPSANKLRSRLRRLQAPLRTFGIVLDLDQRASGKDRARLIGIRKPERAPT